MFKLVTVLYKILKETQKLLLTFTFFNSWLVLNTVPKETEIAYLQR